MDNVLMDIYKKLFDRYGDLSWWPAETPYEVMVGAVLTQNTVWDNVEKAMANFGGNLSPEAVRDMDLDELKKIIYPAGFYNQKAVYLKGLTAWYEKYNYDAETVKNEPFVKLRKELLDVKGVGPETADSILLYAFNLPAFVIDAYTNRMCDRFNVKAGRGYSAVKSYFEDNIPVSVAIYNRFHAMIVVNAKEHCRKKAACSGCPLEGDCAKNGV
ncbi:MAG: endonuclease [Clostridiales bacterium]|jgi:endonuclease-3 related protein|nr:endonuclease [Clostridiales bacterium]